eukprot:GHUV01022166.1.p1 GENE.GHUV01022166.1~~GHUV01022166.1.p1  ORF type:complete len:248 (+),score=67.53 GHUV01022166.1:127-870(+)
MPSDKDDKKAASSSEYTETSSEYEEAQQQRASLFGNHRTRLRWQPSSRTMNLDVRQTLQNRRNLEVKYKGRLNTNSGAYHHIIRLQKNLHQGTPSLARIIAAEQGMEIEGVESINPDKVLPGGLSTLVFRDWTMSPGVKFEQTVAVPAATDGSSSSKGRNDLKYCLTFRKQPQVIYRRSVWDSWLSTKADLQFDSQKQAVGVAGNVRLKVFRLNVTDKQDVQLSAGYDYTWGSLGRTLVRPNHRCSC